MTEAIKSEMTSYNKQLASTEGRVGLLANIAFYLLILRTYLNKNRMF